MSEKITEAFVQQYSAGYEQALQQQTSVLRASVREENFTGERMSFDAVGAVKMMRREGRNQDIPVANAHHKRRWISNEPFVVGDYIDTFDKLKVLSDPTNDYTKAFAAAGARQIDKLIVDAALGDAYTGKNGTTAVALPSSQIIAHGGTGFVFSKLKTGVEKLRTAHALADGDEIHVAWTAKLESAFIDVNEVKSSDFTSVRVIDNGGVEKFYRCVFHRFEDFIGENEDGTEYVDRMLPLVGGIRTALMWVKSGLLLNVPKESKGEVSYDHRKASYFVSASLVAGAVRTHEKKVVAVDCLEA